MSVRLKQHIMKKKQNEILPQSGSLQGSNGFEEAQNKRKDPFGVPENYYETLSDQILQRTTRKSIKVKKEMRLYSPARMAVAASLIVIVTTFVLLVTMQTGLKERNEIAAVSDEEIETYLLEEGVLSEQNLVDELAESDPLSPLNLLPEFAQPNDSLPVKALTAAEKLKSAIDSLLSDDEIIEYLQEENIEPEN